MPEPQTVPIRLCLPRILHNADLASSATRAWEAFLAEDPGRLNYRHSMTFTTIPASYYFIRKLLLARQCPEACLRPALYQTLCASSKDAVLTHGEFCMFLTTSYADVEERVRHGVLEPEEEWTEADAWKYNRFVNAEAWEYVNDVLDTAANDRYHGREKLESVMFG